MEKAKNYLPALCPIAAFIVLMAGEVFFFSTDDSLFTTYFTSCVLSQHLLAFIPFTVNIVSVLLLASEKFNPRIIVSVAVFFEALSCFGDAMGFEYPIHGPAIEYDLRNYGFGRYYLLTCLLTLGLILIIVLLTGRLAIHTYALLSVFYCALTIFRYTSDNVINSQINNYTIYGIIVTVGWAINYCSLFYMGMKLKNENRTPLLNILYSIYSDSEHYKHDGESITTFKELTKKLAFIAYVDEGKEELANAISVLSEAANEVRTGKINHIHSETELKYSLYALGVESKKLSDEGIVDERLADLLLHSVDKEGNDFRSYALRIAFKMFTPKSKGSGI